MSDRDRHKATYYSGKKPYLTHNYRTMMKRRTQEEYYFHELHQDPMSQLLRPYLDDPKIHGFMWEYMAPDWGWIGPPWEYPGPGGEGMIGPYDGHDPPPDEGCEDCTIAGPTSIECGNAWMGQVIPSECAGFITFAVGQDGEEMATAVTDAGFIVVAVPSDTEETAMIICSSGGLHGATCCVTVDIDCCCAEFTVSGAATVSPDSIWSGTVDPPCPTATCEVTSNSGCSLSCGFDGETVTVTVSDTDCGSFTVTITDDKEGCSAVGTATVRINNEGQGGGWVEQSNCKYYNVGPAKHCNAPFQGACYKRSTTINNTCIVGDTKYISARQNCSTNLPGSGCLTGCPLSECPGSCSGSPCAGEGQNNYTCPCSGAGQSGWWWDLTVQLWSCVCP